MLRLFIVFVGILLSFSSINAFAYTETLCAEDENCLQCREDINCQKCYYKCANKYGQVQGDINFAYRLKNTELRALKCYKACWDEEVDIEIRENELGHKANKTFHKKRETQSK